MKKQCGIWIDLRNAWIIQLPVVHDGEVQVSHVASDIEETAHVGGHRSKQPWGPQVDSQEHTIEERRHHQEKDFFERVLDQMDSTMEEVVIFGPSEAKHGMRNLIGDLHEGPKIMGVEGADQMTEHQMVAWVRHFFHRDAPRRLPHT